MLAREGTAVVGVGAVADEVAEAPELRRLRAVDGLEDGLEGVAVAVDVGDDRDLHRVPRVERHADGRAPSSLSWAALVAAEAAVLLLRPRERALAPAPVDVGSYFTTAEIERARAFRRPQLALAAASAALDAALLGALLARPPRALQPRPAATGGGRRGRRRRALGRPDRRRPAAGRRRARALRAVGLTTQSWRGWAGDVAKTTALGSAVAAGASAAAVALMRRFGARWWLPASAGAVAFGVRVAAPARSSWTRSSTASRRCPTGRSAPTCSRWPNAAGVRVGEVFTVDASRRTTGANAYVTGLGPTKRVVLFDTLLEHFTRDEVRLVVAHELAHMRHRDVLRGLAFSALVAPAATAAAARVARGLAAADAQPGPAVLPALALAAGLVAVPVALVANQLSRRDKDPTERSEDRIRRCAGNPLDNDGLAKATLELTGRQVICTFGLINRGKGLEYMIQAAGSWPPVPRPCT